jgi:hypothetical protein
LRSPREKVVIFSQTAPIKREKRAEIGTNTVKRNHNLPNLATKTRIFDFRKIFVQPAEIDHPMWTKRQGKPVEIPKKHAKHPVLSV